EHRVRAQGITAFDHQDLSRKEDVPAARILDRTVGPKPRILLPKRHIADEAPNILTVHIVPLEQIRTDDDLTCWNSIIGLPGSILCRRRRRREEKQDDHQAHPVHSTSPPSK